MAPQVVPATTDMSKQWPFPLASDGWYRAHNALRADLAALASMLSTFSQQLAGGKPITRAQAAAASRFIATFMHFLEKHHKAEDHVVVPYLATRVQMPAKIAADHYELEALIERFNKESTKLLGASLAPVQLSLLPAMQAVFAELRPMLEQHLREEEAEVMPLMRKYFTHKEVEKNVTRKLVKGIDSDGLGTFLRTMSRQERHAFAKQEGIPFFIRWLLFRQAAKYERNVWQPFERLCLVPAN